MNSWGRLMRWVGGRGVCVSINCWHVISLPCFIYFPHEDKVFICDWSHRETLFFQFHHCSSRQRDSSPARSAVKPALPVGRPLDSSPHRWEGWVSCAGVCQIWNSIMMKTVMHWISNCTFTNSEQLFTAASVWTKWEPGMWGASQELSFSR